MTKLQVRADQAETDLKMFKNAKIACISPRSLLMQSPNLSSTRCTGTLNFLQDRRQLDYTSPFTRGIESADVPRRVFSDPFNNSSPPFDLDKELSLECVSER